MKIIKSIISIYEKRNPIKYAQKQGVCIGKETRFIGLPNLGSEPYLITIGNHVTISFDVVFITHDGATWVFRELPRYKEVIKYGKINIKDNCFIGARSVILPGVTIGPNSIVAAGSVVTKDVPSNSVFAGIPAKYICEIEEYAEKCLMETPKYNIENYKKNKREEILKVLSLE